MEAFFGALAGSLIGYLAAFFVAYSTEKGKNLATKEDIGQITTAIEQVKHTYGQRLAEVTEALRSQTTLRFLAAEKRLQVSQEAYRFWGEMFTHMGQETHTSFLREMHEWWRDNCLYLDEGVRSAFDSAMRAYQIAARIDGNLSRQAQFEECVEVIQRLGAIIVEACSLPALAADRNAEEIQPAASVGTPAVMRISPP